MGGDSDGFWFHGLFVMNAGARNSTGTWRTTIKDCLYQNVRGNSPTNALIAPLFFWSDYLDFSYTAVSSSGTNIQTSPTEGTMFIDVRELAAFRRNVMDEATWIHGVLMPRVRH